MYHPLCQQMIRVRVAQPMMRSMQHVDRASTIKAGGHSSVKQSHLRTENVSNENAQPMCNAL